MNTQDLIPAILLTLLSLALTSGAAVFLLFMHWKRKQTRQVEVLFKPQITFTPEISETIFAQRPLTWVAVRTHSMEEVQTALRLNNPTPCNCYQGLTGDLGLFIAPPIHGWILITGSGLPDPADDVDACFRFLIELSRKLGQVQYFNANPALNHHAWVRTDNGRVIRAYAWAGRTLWNQGVKTQAESELGMRCYHYCETPHASFLDPVESPIANTEKVPLLAAAWSIDPATIDEQTLEASCGIAGEPSRLY